MKTCTSHSHGDRCYLGADHIGWHRARLGAGCFSEWADQHADSGPLPFRLLSDFEIQDAARAIAASSKSKEEIQCRLKDELGYPYGDAAISFHEKGGLHMASIMLHGPRGFVIFV